MKFVYVFNLLILLIQDMTKHQTHSVVMEDTYTVLTMCLSEPPYLFNLKTVQREGEQKAILGPFLWLHVGTSLVITFCWSKFFKPHAVVTLCLALGLKRRESFLCSFSSFCFQAQLRLCGDRSSLHVLSCSSTQHFSWCTLILVRAHVPQIWGQIALCVNIGSMFFVFSLTRLHCSQGCIFV